MQILLQMHLRDGRVPNRKRSLAHPKCKHNPFTQFPKNPNCPICNESKTNRAQCRTKTYARPDQLPKPLKFGDSLSADHKILNDDDASREADKAMPTSQNRPLNALSISSDSLVLSLSLNTSTQTIRKNLSVL